MRRVGKLSGLICPGCRQVLCAKALVKTADPICPGCQEWLYVDVLTCIARDAWISVSFPTGEEIWHSECYIKAQVEKKVAQALELYSPTDEQIQETVEHLVARLGGAYAEGKHATD